MSVVLITRTCAGRHNKRGNTAVSEKAGDVVGGWRAQGAGVGEGASTGDAAHGNRLVS